MSGELSEADFISEARRRLAEWGHEDWRQRKLGGFARESLESILKDYKMVPRASGMRKEPDRPDVIEVDSIVSSLARNHPAGRDIALTLWLFYAFRKTEGAAGKDSTGREHLDDITFHEGGRLSPAEVGLMMKPQRSRAQVRAWLDIGDSWVAARLSACV